MLEVHADTRYPLEIAVRSGERFTVRPAAPSDKAALMQFYNDIPRDDLIYLDNNPRDPAVIEGWAEGSLRGEVAHFLALAPDGRIAAACLIYQTQRGWRSHQGRLRVVVRPEWRRMGLGSKLIKEMIQACLNAGLDMLVAEFTPNQTAAMEAFSQRGFLKIAQIPHFVRDLEGHDHDLVLMARNIREQEYFAGD